MRNGWCLDDDWAIPGTMHLVTDYAQGLPLVEAARDLGVARGLQGIGLTETIEDLGAFFTAARAPIDALAQQWMTSGWVTATESVSKQDFHTNGGDETHGK